MTKKLLVVNFFPAFFPPSSGGEQRYYYLYLYLSNYFDITLLSPTHADHCYEVVNFTENFREHRVPKELIHIQLHQEMNRLNIGPECSALVVALAGGIPNKFHEKFLELSEKADLIIHDCPFTLPYDHDFANHTKPRIYNSYNVEYLLMSQIFQGSAKNSCLNFIKSLESALVEKAKIIFATSNEEKMSFCETYECKSYKISLAPNGFEPTENNQCSTYTKINKYLIENRPIVIFMGSAHPPNIEAGTFICEEVAPKLSGFNFLIMGSVCQYIHAKSENLILLGFLSNLDKMKLLDSCSVAINPMFSGAGTNLKMLDYMAAAAPIVTTNIGARGLALNNGIDALIVEEKEFNFAISRLVKNRKVAKRLGENAKKTAYEKYTWQSIARSIAPILKTVIDESETHVNNKPRKKLLVINDFSVANANGGGQIRIKELLTELALNFDITLLCLSDLMERTETFISERFLEVCVPKTEEHRRIEAEKNALSHISINDIIAAEHCLSNPLFRQVFCQYAATAEAIIFEHPYLAPMLKLLPYETTIIYSSLNCEFYLKQEILKSRPDFEIVISQVKKLEDTLLKAANLVVCVSESDRDCFAKDFPDQNYLIIENGVRYECYKGLFGKLLSVSNINPRKSPLALFLGSAHKPNLDAAYYICNVLAPALPSILFGIIGSVCNVLRNHSFTANVWLFEILDDDTKNHLMKNATIAINPLFTGGGSSLKVPDFFASELPLISTEIGVRGYNLINGIHYLLADSSNFSERVYQLISDISLQKKLRQNAMAFVKENLDWPILGKRYSVALNLLLTKKNHIHRKLLVVSYRFSDPPLGGAEVYLNNILQELSAIGDFTIDVATYDVGKLFNKWHFSAEYMPAFGQASKPDYLAKIIRFPLNIQDQDTDFKKCQKLFSLWMSESLSQGREFLDLLDHPILLGGWNFPERNNDGSFARWSGKKANIFLGIDTKSIRMQGTVPCDNHLAIRMDGMNLQNGVSGTFDLQINLPESMYPILEINVAGSSVIGYDARELGAYFRRIEVENKNGWHPIMLDEDYTTYVRAINIERWVHSLIKQTEQRKFEDDQLFLDVRGPKSSALLQWLDNHISSYDIVLAQGVPFASSVDTLHIAKCHGIPCVILPHFHMEDKYYHWRSFYQAFQKADLVLAAPNLAKRIFFDRLGVNSVVVLGGAADPSEFTLENLKIASEAFSRVHFSSRPFMLVLGRKAGGKNYRLAIDALIHLKRHGYLIDLVMIGPDDDEVKIDTLGVFYLGMQPRNVVIGALAECLCVVNMSTSESFGIVLIEAWLAGRPVIAQRNCAAFVELVRDGENGSLVETPEEISDSVIKYLSDINYAKRCGRVGREDAKRYTWFRLAEFINNCLINASIRQAN